MKRYAKSPSGNAMVETADGPYVRLADIGRAGRDVLDERARQQGEEGWTAEHDDRHTDRSLAMAAACYAYEAAHPDALRNEGIVPPEWPWAREWWKPTDYRRDLVKAAALIIAEIERLDRT